MKPESSSKAPKVRTAHGTRVARRIVCSACNNSDVLHFIPRHSERVLCRPCAAKMLGVADPDSGIFPEHDETCTACGKVERTRLERPEGFLCKDCFLGIATPQSERVRMAERLNTGNVLRVRRAKGSPHGRG